MLGHTFLSTVVDVVPATVGTVNVLKPYEVDRSSFGETVSSTASVNVTINSPFETPSLGTCKYLTVYTAGSEFCYGCQIVGAVFNNGVLSEHYNSSTTTDVTSTFVADTTVKRAASGQQAYTDLYRKIAEAYTHIMLIDNFDSHPAISVSASASQSSTDTTTTPTVILRDTYNVINVKPAILKNINTAVLFSQCNFGDSY